MARWIRADGTSQVVAPEKGRKFKLEELQRFVGGYIERVRTRGPHPRNMWVNEEGLLKDLPVNAEATMLIDPNYLHDGVRGDVLVTEPGEVD